MTDIERAREFFKGDTYATVLTGAEIDTVAEKSAICSLKLRDEHRNAVGSVMGGAIFTLADFTFAVAANFNSPTTVSNSSNITFLSTAKGDTLYAQAECIRSGRTTCLYKITVTDNLGTLCAYVTINGYIVG